MTSQMIAQSVIFNKVDKFHLYVSRCVTREDQIWTNGRNFSILETHIIDTVTIGPLYYQKYVKHFAFLCNTIMETNTETAHQRAPMVTGIPFTTLPG